MEIIAWIVGIAVSLLAGRLLFGLFFVDTDDFWECVKYSFMPDIVSLFRGEYLHDCWMSMRLSIYLLLSFGAGFGSHYGVTSLIGILL